MYSFRIAVKFAFTTLCTPSPNAYWLLHDASGLILNMSVDMICHNCTSLCDVRMLLACERCLTSILVQQVFAWVVSIWVTRQNYSLHALAITLLSDCSMYI